MNELCSSAVDHSERRSAPHPYMLTAADPIKEFNDIEHGEPTALTARQRVALGCVLLIFCILATALAATRAPQHDEGHFGNAAHIFAQSGRLAMPMWTDWVQSLDKWMFVAMPLYFVSLGEWFKVFGEGWLAMRLFSVFWGLILVSAWFLTGRTFTGKATTGIAVAAMVGLNYDMINMSSARYDIMAAGLGAAGLACYVTLRHKHLSWAVLVSLACTVTAFLSHPYGALSGFGLVAFAVVLDLRRLRPKHLVVALVPFIIGFGLWGLYIMQAPDVFRTQFAENATGRLAAYHHPLQALIAELRGRYLLALGGWGPDVPLISRAKIFLVVSYALGVGVCLVTPALRRLPGVRALLLYLSIIFVLLWFFESYRWYIYSIHILPLYAAALGLAIEHVAGTRQRARPLMFGTVAVYALFSMASVGYRARQNVQHTAYAPTAAYLRERIKPGDLVMAGGEFGMDLGFETHVLDDLRLGFWNHRKPDYFVIDKVFEREQAASSAADPKFAEHVKTMLATYKLIYQNEKAGYFYRVYALD